MSRKVDKSLPSHAETEATRREQALCRMAIDSGEYDNLSDKEWVMLCESVAKKEEEAAAAAREESSTGLSAGVTN